MSRTFTIKELNEKIDKLIRQYARTAESFYNDDDDEQGSKYMAKVDALQDLKLLLNDPEPIVNVTEKVQESLNVITAQNIVNNDL